jgi:hypothetical protein
VANWTKLSYPSSNNKLTFRRSAGAVSFTRTIFIVKSTNTYAPLSYLAIKLPGHIDGLRKREQADTEMRNHVRGLLDSLILHGVSALGVRLAFYEFDATKTSFVRPVR